MAGLGSETIRVLVPLTEQCGPQWQEPGTALSRDESGPRLSFTLMTLASVWAGFRGDETRGSKSD